MRFCGVSLALLAGVVSAVDRLEIIDLPTGFPAEGITKGRGWTAFVGSFSNGSIWKVDLLEGVGELVVEGEEGGSATGLDYDKRTDYLFVASGSSESSPGTGRVYDINYDMVAEISLTNASEYLINDVYVTEDYAYFTDSYQPQFYAVPLTSDGYLTGMEPTTIYYQGDFEFVSGSLNANGIVASDDGSMLIIANSATSSLYLVDAMTGDSTLITLSGLLAADGSVDESAALTSIAGDGLERRRNTLWACQNTLFGGASLVAEINLSADWTSGYISKIFTSDRFGAPSGVDRLINGLYVVTTKLTVVDGVSHEIVRIDRDETGTE